MLPEQVFARLGVVRCDARTGWAGGGRAVLDALDAVRSGDVEEV